MTRRTQLFCLPCAGGSASLFDGLRADDRTFDATAIEYPGHGDRLGESCCTSIDSLADDAYVQLLKRYQGNSYALFGYSMGSAVLVELLNRILAKSEMAEPRRVFIAAHEPRNFVILPSNQAQSEDETIKRMVIGLGGLPKMLLDNAAFWRLYLPIYQADFKCLMEYGFENLGLRTHIPASVFFSRDETTETAMSSWNRYFNGEMALHGFEGGHFFINDRSAEICSIIQRELARS